MGDVTPSPGRRDGDATGDNETPPPMIRWPSLCLPHLSQEDGDSRTDPGCAYDYGWHAAPDALATGKKPGEAVLGHTWWLDVETTKQVERRRQVQTPRCCRACTTTCAATECRMSGCTPPATSGRRSPARTPPRPQASTRRPGRRTSRPDTPCTPRRCGSRRPETTAPPGTHVPPASPEGRRSWSRAGGVPRWALRPARGYAGRAGGAGSRSFRATVGLHRRTACAPRQVPPRPQGDGSSFGCGKPDSQHCRCRSAVLTVKRAVSGMHGPGDRRPLREGGSSSGHRLRTPTIRGTDRPRARDHKDDSSRSPEPSESPGHPLSYFRARRGGHRCSAGRSSRRRRPCRAGRGRCGAPAGRAPCAAPGP
jgi:hypothetical protein